MAELSLHDKLVDIQHRLSVPKDQKNSFGNYNYRNIEDVEAAVKPLLHEHKLTLRFDDTITVIAGRVYVRATALLSNGGDTIAVDAYAREAETKKGMDDAQITGAASSYARKYAAGGLFLIDNGKDADSDDNTAHKAPRKAGSATAAKTINFASQKSQDWIRATAEKYVPFGQETDDWIESVLTIKPSEVPQYKVKDAVDRIEEVGKEQSAALQALVDNLDTIYQPPDEPINLDNAPY